MKKDASIIIKGRPITKKNSQQITYNPKLKRRQIVQSDQYQAYEEECLWRLKNYNGPTFEGAIRIQTRYWMPNKRSWPDLVGLMQATWDILEKAGIIDNDRNVVNPDGSRIMGIDRKNPRVEIFIEQENEYKIEEVV